MFGAYGPRFDEAGAATRGASHFVSWTSVGRGSHCVSDSLRADIFGGPASKLSSDGLRRRDFGEKCAEAATIRGHPDRQQHSQLEDLRGARLMPTSTTVGPRPLPRTITRRGVESAWEDS
jgi:hypothetical protein